MLNNKEVKPGKKGTCFYSCNSYLCNVQTTNNSSLVYLATKLGILNVSLIVCYYIVQKFTFKNFSFINFSFKLSLTSCLISIILVSKNLISYHASALNTSYLVFTLLGTLVEIIILMTHLCSSRNSSKTKMNITVRNIFFPTIYSNYFRIIIFS